MELDDFTMYVPCTSILSDPIHSPPTFWLKVTPSRHTPAVELYPKIITRQKYPARSFVFSCRSLTIFLENISSASTNCSRDSFQIGVQYPYPFLLILFIRVNLVIYKFLPPSRPPLHSTILHIYISIYLSIYISLFL